MKAHLAVAALLAWLGPAGWQAPQQPVFRSTVDLVRVDVLVTDQGKPVAGLGAADFDLRDSGQPQQIDRVAAESDGLDVILAFDVSESVEGVTLAALKDSARAVLGALQPRDRVQLLTFSHRVAVRTPMTNDTSLVRSAIGRVAASGSTSLMDGLYTALALRELGERRSMILLFSDGRDNRSWLGPSQVLQIVRETDTVVYAVAFRPHERRERAALAPDMRLLEDLTSAAGGRLVWCDEASRMRGLFLDVLGEMRSRYVLMYYPSGVPRGGWHPIEVALKGKKGKVIARTGYLSE